MPARKLTKIEINSMISSGVWRDECPIHYSRLRMIELEYLNFENFVRKGKMVLLDSVAEQVVCIFEELLKLGFQINSVNLMDLFDADDVKSMKANNSSAYNGRLVARTNRWSSHAYGVAIDINPVQNPYLLLNEREELLEVIPSAGSEYLDRSNKRKGMVEEIVPIFAKHGFTEWGGNWELKPDYHHFQLPWDKIKELFPDSVV